MPQDGVLRRVLTVAVAAGLSNGPGLVAQDPAGATRTVLVTVEFRALQNGTPLSDLRPQDVRLRVDNVDRDLVALDLVRPEAGGSSMPPPFATNGAVRRGRDVLFVVDEESYQLGGESRVREAIGAAIRRLTTLDRAGLVSLHASGVSLALTSSKASLQAALSKIRGRAISTESATTLSCRTRRQVPVMTSLFQSPDMGVTTTIVLVSAALAAPQAASIVTPGIDRACQLTAEDFDEFRSVSARSAAQLYAMHVADGTATGVDARLGAGLERFAGEAGGQFLRVSGDPAPAVERIVDDAGAFYVAYFMIEPAGRPTKRAVDLRVLRDGATARYARELVTPAVESKTVSTRDMIRTTSAFRALQLRAAAFASRDTEKTAKVVVLFEPVEAGVSLTSAMAGLFDAKGTLVSQWTPESQDLAGRPVLAGLAAAPGGYRLRVAAVDSRGRSGAVDQDVTVGPFAAGSVTTSGVILGVQGTGPFFPRLQMTAADTVAHVYFEAYGAGPCVGLSATIEIAPALQAPAIARSTAGASPIENSDGCIMFGEYSVAALPPGDYAFRIRLQRGETVLALPLRSLRKAGR
jgi:hypothetical protein